MQILINQIEDYTRYMGFLPKNYDPTCIVARGLSTNISQHATEVRDIIREGLRDTGVDYKILHDEITNFAGKQGLGSGLYSGPLNFWRWPIKAKSNIENGSCAITHIQYLDALAKIDQRIERDNVVSIWALPNKGQEATGFGMARGLFNQAKNVIAVGCTNGNHYEWPTRKVDVLGPKEWSSWNAPYVSAIAALVVNRFVERTGSYHWAKVKYCVINGVKNRREDGVGEADAYLALQLADSMIAIGV